MRLGRASTADGTRSAPGTRAVPLSLFAASCAPMLVMLPAGLTGVLASLGIRAEAGWVQALADPLAPVAQPLLVVSTLLLAIGSLSCGRLPVVAALGGGALVYLGMYVVTGPGGQTEPALFYPGLALLLASPVLSVIRPRVGACRPLLARANARKLLLVTVVASAFLVATAPAIGWGTATASLHAQHAGRQAETKAPAPRSAPPTVRVRQDGFLWSGRVRNYTSRRAWFPPISTDGALLRVHGQTERGSVFVQLMDGRAVVVYERTLDRIPRQGLQVAARGVRGIWMVTLGFRGYSGRPKVEVGPLPGK